MLSFNNDPALKALHVEQAKRHFAENALVSRTYGDMSASGWKGCSVGCFAYDISQAVNSPHAVVAEARHLPEWLIRLQDSIFEGLPTGDREVFHVQLAEKIPVGVDLGPVAHWVAISRIDRLIAVQTRALGAEHAFGVSDAIRQTIAALEVGRRAHEAAAGGNACGLSTTAARSAESAARSAESAARSAESAARSAESAWSAWSARSAAESAAWSARSAAWSARSAGESAATAAWSARSAAESAARSARSAESAARSAESAAWSAERDALFAALDRAGGAA